MLTELSKINIKTQELESQLGQLRVRKVAIISDLFEIIKSWIKEQGFNISAVRGGSRVDSLVGIRVVLCVFMRRKLQMTLQEIGKFLGRDHTTIMHHLQQPLNVKRQNLLNSLEKYVRNDRNTV